MCFLVYFSVFTAHSDQSFCQGKWERALPERGSTIPERGVGSRKAQLWENIPEHINATHRCAALKAPAPIASLSPGPWVEEFPEVWIKDKAEYGTLKGACVLIEGNDPSPQEPYEYPAKAEIGIGKTIEWDVITPTQSICNAPLWPVLKADGLT